MLHVANLLTDGIVGHQPGSYLAQGYYCVAAVTYILLNLLFFKNSWAVFLLTSTPVLDFCVTALKFICRQFVNTKLRIYALMRKHLIKLVYNCWYTVQKSVHTTNSMSVEMDLCKQNQFNDLITVCFRLSLFSILLWIFWLFSNYR